MHCVNKILTTTQKIYIEAAAATACRPVHNAMKYNKI